MCVGEGRIKKSNSQGPGAHGILQLDITYACLYKYRCCVALFFPRFILIIIHGGRKLVSCRPDSNIGGESLVRQIGFSHFAYSHFAYSTKNFFFLLTLIDWLVFDACDRY